MASTPVVADLRLEARCFLVIALATALCAACPRLGAAQGPPAGWIAIAPPTDEEGWLCALGSRDEWNVQRGEPGSTVRIERAQTQRDEIVLYVRDGRVVGKNRGELGGSILWERTGSSRKILVLSGNPVAFVTSPAGVFVAEGLAHFDITRGRVLELQRVRKNWKVKDVVDLGAAPQAVSLVAPTSLLVLTSRGVTEVNLAKRTATQLFVNERWRYLPGNSIVRLTSGVTVAGMRRAVVVLIPASGGVIERWWVPSSCARLQKTGEAATCRCANN